MIFGAKPEILERAFVRVEPQRAGKALKVLHPPGRRVLE